MRTFQPAAAHALAAEYVLGTLRGRARLRFEALMSRQPYLADVVKQWEVALAPLAERIAPMEAPSRVWKEIEARITPRPTEARSNFWRAFGLVAGGVASVLFAFFVWISTGPRVEPMFVAVLTETNASPRMVVSMHEPNLLRVRMLKPWSGMEKQSLELWALSHDGKPRSLGLVVNAMGDTMMRIEPTDPRMQGAKMLAVSMEPMGGSRTGAPTGAVVCSGPIAPVKRA
jgi:anti-sigma-K factor RskA